MGRSAVESFYLELAMDQRICSRWRVRDRERKIEYSVFKGTDTLVRDREKFEIWGDQDREIQL